MLRCSPNTTWFQGFSNLFCSKNLLPMSNMSLEDQINAITRIVLIIGIVILIFDKKCSVVFIIVSLLFIIILYYLQRNMIDNFKTESFVPMGRTEVNVSNKLPHPTKQVHFQDPDDNSNNPKYQVPPKPKVSYIYGNCDYDFQVKNKSNNFNPLFCNDGVDAYSNASMNQRLAGKPNPKTLIPPVSVTPAFDSQWRSTSGTIDFKGQNNREPTWDLFQSGYKSIDDIDDEGPYSGSYESYHSNNSAYKSNMKDTQYNRINNRSQMGDDNSFLQRNMNIQTIQPGVYYKNNGLETVSSNIGITETDWRNEPVKTVVDNGDVYYDEYNNTSRFKKEPLSKSAGPEDIYDPRFTGYGTSYRSYFDDYIGQPKFYYDDVNAMRMPNYITRSKIDHLDFAESYGPVSDNYEERNEHMREAVNQSFLDNSLLFRNDLQERLMRKRNSEMVYNRQFPKSTAGRRMLRG